MTEITAVYETEQNLKFLLNTAIQNRDKAESQIAIFQDSTQKYNPIEYWEGRKHEAEIFITALRTMGISDG